MAHVYIYIYTYIYIYGDKKRIMGSFSQWLSPDRLQNFMSNFYKP